jgi:hypothetical protein
MRNLIYFITAATLLAACGNDPEPYAFYVEEEDEGELFHCCVIATMELRDMETGFETTHYLHDCYFYLDDREGPYVVFSNREVANMDPNQESYDFDIWPTSSNISLSGTCPGHYPYAGPGVDLD